MEKNVSQELYLPELLQTSRHWLPCDKRNRRWHCTVELMNGVPTLIATINQKFKITEVKLRIIECTPDRSRPRRKEQIPVIMSNNFSRDNRSLLLHDERFRETTTCEVMVTGRSMKGGHGG